MKRARRQTVRRGLTGRQRRRLARRLRDIAQRWGRGCYALGPHAQRDARRLAEAGLAIAVVSKDRPWNPRRREITLFPNLSAALARYPRSCLLPGRYRGLR